MQRCSTEVVSDEGADLATVCVALGGHLTITLRAGFVAPRVSGDALGSAAAVPTPKGRVGWQFAALRSGTSDITVSRSRCPSAGPGPRRCVALPAYRLHVAVP